MDNFERYQRQKQKTLSLMKDFLKFYKLEDDDRKNTNDGVNFIINNNIIDLIAELKNQSVLLENLK